MRSFEKEKTMEHLQVINLPVRNFPPETLSLKLSTKKYVFVIFQVSKYLRVLVSVTRTTAIGEGSNHSNFDKRTNLQKIGRNTNLCKFFWENMYFPFTLTIKTIWHRQDARLRLFFLWRIIKFSFIDFFVLRPNAFFRRTLRRPNEEILWIIDEGFGIKRFPEN